MYFRAQMAVPRTVIEVLKQIEREAVYVGFFSFVGPEPQCGGSLQVMT